MYLITYPLGRFLLEFLRLDSSLVSGVNANQTLMAIVAVAAVALLIWRHKDGRSQPSQEKKRRRRKKTAES